MNPTLKKWLSLGGYTIWFSLFLWGVGDTALKARRLYHSQTLLSLQTRLLKETTADVYQLIKGAHAQSSDLVFFQNLFNLLPQTEAYVRTQKALMSDVQDLRQKINRRLRGRLHILVDSKANVLYLKDGMNLLLQADCSVGRGGIFNDKKSGRRWEFATPRGKFRVLEKMKNPIWIKPDWAFLEDGKPPPPPDDPARRVEGELGAYVFNLGDGYLIHGTKSPELLGRPASHGCVRLGATALETLYLKVPIGTEVYIY